MRKYSEDLDGKSSDLVLEIIKECVPKYVKDFDILQPRLKRINDRRVKCRKDKESAKKNEEEAKVLDFERQIANLI